MTRAAISMEKYPAASKRVSGAVIHKPGYNDNTKLTAYHSISLLRYMGKVVENVVAELHLKTLKQEGDLATDNFEA